MKNFRKLCGVGLALVLMVSAGIREYAEAADWHYNGGIARKGRCDNTYRACDCGSVVSTVTAYSHQLPDGRICYVYAETHCHTVTCSSCGYVFIKNATGCCRTWHSIAHTAPVSGHGDMGEESICSWSGMAEAQKWEEQMK